MIIDIYQLILILVKATRLSVLSRWHLVNAVDMLIVFMEWSFRPDNRSSSRKSPVVVRERVGVEKSTRTVNTVLSRAWIDHERRCESTGSSTGSALVAAVSLQTTNPDNQQRFE
jgi:hypothetical protein